MSEILRPRTDEEVRAAVQWAVASENVLDVAGGGTKRALGHPFVAGAVLDLRDCRGIVSYEPAELVMTAMAGTPRQEVEAALAEENQMLAFEPMDTSFLLEEDARAQSIGAVFACNLAGPRRPRSGAARDHLLGARGISGRGEGFRTGGRVVKNVTGYDLAKLLCGSYGTLAVMTEISFKVLPAPIDVRTLVFPCSCHEKAARLMRDAANTPYSPEGLAWLPRSSGGEGRVLMRLEGNAPALAERAAALAGLEDGGCRELDRDESLVLWRDVRDLRLFHDFAQWIWRFTVPPFSGPSLVADLSALVAGGRSFADWGGGLVWLAHDPVAGEQVADLAARLRQRAEAVGGTAMLFRAPAEIRGRIPVFHPRPTPLAALERRVREAFDPKHILCGERMGSL